MPSSTNTVNTKPTKRTKNSTFHEDSIGNPSFQSQTPSLQNPLFTRLNSGLSVNSKTSRNSRRGDDFGTIYGQPTVFIVRLKGAIYTLSTMTELLNKGPLKNAMTEYILPQKRIFIPTVTNSEKLDFLSENKGVKKDNLTAAGRGEFAPLMSNDTPEGKAKNRRIEIILTPKLDEISKMLNEL